MGYANGMKMLCRMKRIWFGYRVSYGAFFVLCFVCLFGSRFVCFQKVNSHEISWRGGAYSQNLVYPALGQAFIGLKVVAHFLFSFIYFRNELQLDIKVIIKASDVSFCLIASYAILLK